MFVIGPSCISIIRFSAGTETATPYKLTPVIDIREKEIKVSTTTPYHIHLINIKMARVVN